MDRDNRKSYECMGNGIGIPNDLEKLKKRSEINRCNSLRINAKH